MISIPNLEKAKKLIRKSERPILVRAQDGRFNRKILEFGRFDVLVFPQEKEEKFEHEINEVSAKISAKNKIKIGVDLEKIRYLEKKEKAKVLAKIKQDIKILRKAKADLVLLNYKDERDAFDLLISLGASTEQAKKAFYEEIRRREK